MKYIISCIVLLFAVNASADNNNLDYIEAQRYKCEMQKVVDLDDGISNAEIIGKAVASACEEACLKLGEYWAKQKSVMFNHEIRNKYFQSCIDYATRKVLEHRVDIKKDGVIEIININDWQYKHSKTTNGKFYSIDSLAESTPSFLDIECVDSNNTSEIASVVSQ